MKDPSSGKDAGFERARRAHRQEITVDRIKRGEEYGKMVDSGFIRTVAESDGLLIRTRDVAIFLPRRLVTDVIRSGRRARIVLVD